MDKKLYQLMNWPDIEGITYSECDDPHALLGGHMTEDGFLVQVFRPDAYEVTIHVSGNRKYLMEKVDEAGFFAVLIPAKRKLKYTIGVENVEGRKELYTDPYAFEPQFQAEQLRSLSAGTCERPWKILGAQEMEIDRTAGVQFAVWAPHALRVSMVSDCNDWDGRRMQMKRMGDSGIFALFVPGMQAGDRYQYEVKARGGHLTRKADPYAQRSGLTPDLCSVVGEIPDFDWEDADFLEKRKQTDYREEPFSVYEIQPDVYLPADDDAAGHKQDWASIAEQLTAYVVETGYTHVELLPVAESGKEAASGTGAAGYYVPAARFGTPEAMMTLVNTLHKAGIGVILDWNAAYFAKETHGLVQFDGSKTYEMFRTPMDQYPGIELYTFDYSRPQVCNFLTASARFWAEQYHIDGLKIDALATMLYLDYGKQPGEWIPNLYGGNENLYAVEFLTKLNKAIHREFPGILMIAEDSSAWATVTGEPTEECLGFDFKWNHDFRQDLLAFMEQDPLFRKGQYDNLSASMIYHYMENFILELSHDAVRGQEALCERLPETELKARLSDFRAMLGFFFSHPGKKLLFMGQDLGMKWNWNGQIGPDWKELQKPEYQGMKAYLSVLQQLYRTTPALYELDYEQEGFEWLNNADADRTVISFLRRDRTGNPCLAVINFTPVAREDYRLGVPAAGKYTEILNSDAEEFGGNGMIREAAYCSDDKECNGRADSICVTLPPLSAVWYSYQPYTEIEKKEQQIRKAAALAKEKAEEEARIAERLKREAEEEARQALDAEERARKAAKAALAAQKKAEQKAAKALEASQKIEEEARQKLKDLKRKAPVSRKTATKRKRG